MSGHLLSARYGELFQIARVAAQANVAVIGIEMAQNLVKRFNLVGGPNASGQLGQGD